jgi:hypothetical protein
MSSLFWREQGCLRRYPLLVSSILHLLVISVLLSVPVLSPSRTLPSPEPEAIEVRERVFLPPAERLRRIMPRSPAPANLTRQVTFYYSVEPKDA